MLLFISPTWGYYSTMINAIVTGESLVDPVAFVRENVNISQTDLPTDGHTLVAGADFDVQIRQKGPHETAATGRSDGTVSTLLDTLFIRGNAQGMVLSGRVVDLEWYPSAQYTNTLAAELGLRPGEDVLRATVSPYDKDRHLQYRDHLARFEYPRSTGLANFGTDRGFKQVAALLLPTAVTRNVVEFAAKTPDKHVRTDGSGTRVGRDLINYFSLALESSGRIMGATSEGKTYESMGDGSTWTISFLLSLMKLNMTKRNEHIAVERLIAHHQTLAPQIRRLQLDAPKLNDRPGVLERGASQPALPR